MVGMLHCAGRYVLLNRTAEMVRHDMVSAKVDGGEIKLSLSERTLTDHFHDQVDHRKFAELNGKALQKYRSIALDGQASRRIRDMMGKLTFPWQTSQGVMVGYTADPEIDAYFLASVSEDTLQWRDDSGIHPQADLGSCSGELLTTVVHVLMSFCIKHIMFVEEALKIHPGINQHMSLTIWKTQAELLQTLRVVTGATVGELAAALDMITVRRRDASFFRTEQAPGMPLLIEVSEGYLLTPVSGVFRNPLNCIRMLRESTSESARNAFRKHREHWMVADLYALFEGPRFQCARSSTKLRRGGKVVTDVDAAILDGSTHELVLFQLKWQDFNTSNIRTQRSKAKNFRDQVENWAQKTISWIDEFGVGALCRALGLRPIDGREPSSVRLIAVGRSNARFRSYGYTISNDVLVLPWSQFVRLRLAIGPGQDFFRLLMEAVIQEAAAPINRTPLPYVLERHGLRLVFEDIWSDLEDQNVPPVGQAPPGQ